MIPEIGKNLKKIGKKSKSQPLRFFTINKIKIEISSQDSRSESLNLPGETAWGNNVEK